MSTSIKKTIWVISLNMPWKIPDGKVLAHLGFNSKVLPKSLTDISAWVGFYTSSPQQGVKCQLRLKNKFWGIFLNMPWKIPDGKVLAHLGLNSKVFSRPLTDLRFWEDFCTSCPQQGV